MNSDSESQPLNPSKSQVHYISIPISRDPTYNVNATVGNAATLPEAGFVTRRRKSILDQPIGSFRGVNSLSRFATSFRRANSFLHIETQPNIKRSYFEDNTDQTFDPDTFEPVRNGRRLSVALGVGGTDVGSISENPFYDDDYGSVSYFDNVGEGATGGRVASQTGRIHSISARGSTTVDRASLLHRAISISELTSNLSKDGYNGAIATDTESIVLKRVEDKDGNVVTLLAGQSTGPQTIFNSINILIGIGMFALPLGLKYAGWIPGITMLLIFAVSTYCTAELLSRCMDTDPTIMSYADLSYVAFGNKGRALISCLFTLDLTACAISLVVLFADSLNALFPAISVTQYKLICFFVVTPPVFIPLSILSNISLLGILSTIGTLVVITVCGFIKRDAPGSLLDPMPTQLWPTNFKNFCLSIGLLSACWGGHAVFPNLKTDMRHPEKFNSCLVQTYKITCTTDIGTAIIGYLMFGAGVQNEITKNVLLSDGYPNIVYGLISALMTVIPVAKTPLNARPIISVLDSIFHVENAEAEYTGAKLRFAKMIKVLNCIAVNVMFVVMAILFPQFDKLIALLGAGLVFSICFILPCLFYIKICKDTIKPWEKVACYITIVISSILATMGIAAAIFG